MIEDFRRNWRLYVGIFLLSFGTGNLIRTIVKAVRK